MHWKGDIIPKFRKNEHPNGHELEWDVLFDVTKEIMSINTLDVD